MGTGQLFQFKTNIIFITNHDQVKVSFFFDENMNLNAENLTSTQSFPPLGRWSFCFSTPPFKGSEVVMRWTILK